jgi:hypothetical protein
MSNQQQYAAVPLPPPGSYRDSILRDAYAVGSLDEYFAGLQQSVAHQSMLRRLEEGARVHAAVERTQAATRIANCAMLVDGLDRIARRLDSFEAEVAIRRQRAAFAAEREEQERIRAALDQLPDIDDPAAQHIPGGELHELPPVPVQEDQGDLPRELHAGAPPHSGNFTEPDPAALGHPYDDPKQVSQPTSVSLW